MAGELVVKALIEDADLFNFLHGVDKSKLRKGNKIVVNWLQTSHNMQKKLRITFHTGKFKLGQFEKGSRRETEEDNRQKAL